MKYMKELFNKIKEFAPQNIQVLIYVILWSIGLTIVSVCAKFISLMWF